MEDHAPKKRPLRADAAVNRAKIMTAARRVFAARGLDVSIEEIAIAANVGATTVIRRFRDQDGLIEALFEEEMAANAALARKALAASDAGEGLASFLRSLFRRVATDRGIAQVILSARYGLGEIAARRLELTDLIHEVVERARTQGSLRARVEAADLPILMLMVGSVADFTAGTNPEVWERYSELLVNAVVSSGDSAAWQGTALTRAQLTDAMAAWQPPARLSHGLLPGTSRA